MTSSLTPDFLASKARIDQLLTSKFHRKLFDATVQSLETTSNPLFFTNFCTGFRELVRHVLFSFAPDLEVRRCCWFVSDSTSRTGMTRAHAIKYIIQGGLTDKYVVEVLEFDSSAFKAELLKAVDILNKFTHVNEETFEVNVIKAAGIGEACVSALADVLDQAAACRSSLAQALENHIEREVLSAAISESIDAIDEIASHYSVEGVDIASFSVTGIDSSSVYFDAEGTIYVELQWGSNSDVRKGDGAISSQNFRFKCSLESPVNSNEVEVCEETFGVDTSSWWESWHD